MRPIFWSLHGIVAGTDRRIGIAEKSLSKMELIPSPIDQNPCAHWRKPMDMMRQG
jgi:hypothetical protein